MDRDVAVKDYVKVKGRCWATKRTILYAHLIVIFNKLKTIYDIAHAIHVRKLRFKWGAFKIVYSLKKNIRRRFGKKTQDERF